MYCYDCEEELEEGEGVYSDIDGELYCESCYDDRFSHCEHCGCEVENDYMWEIEETNEYVCEDCYNNYREEHDDISEEDNPYIIGSYHHRDLPLDFKYLDSELVDGRTPEDLLYFGIELEVYNKEHKISNTKMANMLRQNFSELSVVFEEDGSIGDGFENIFPPMTINYAMAKKETIFNYLKMLSDNGFTSHNSSNCGLHIHFSRNFFKDNEDKYIQKLTLFFETYKNELQIFSRRNSFNWCNWVSDVADYDKRYLKSSVILKDYIKEHPSHNIAINTGNNDTIEIRIFRGTLKFETFMASLELVNSIVRTIKTKETRKISFDNVVNMAGNEYVQKYCEDKNLYNSQYLNDETKNVMKEIETKRQKIEETKIKCKEVMTETLKDLTNLSKETSKDIDFNNEDLRITLNILGQINSVLSCRLNDTKNSDFEEDTTDITISYKKYIDRYNSYGNPVRYYSGLINDISYIINDNNDSELMNKLRTLYNTAQENLNKLRAITNNNTNGEE